MTTKEIKAAAKQVDKAVEQIKEKLEQQLLEYLCAAIEKNKMLVRFDSGMGVYFFSDKNGNHIDSDRRTVQYRTLTDTVDEILETLDYVPNITIEKNLEGKVLVL